MKELDALTILTCLPHLGSIKIQLLLRHFGSAINVLNADPKEIIEWPGFGKKIAHSLANWKKNDAWKHNLELAQQHQVKRIPYTGPEYPKHLLEISDHPIILYAKGELEKSDHQSIAIVGTRQTTLYGQEMAKTLAHDLAAMGFTVVSGLARGIDTAAHKGALKTGRTIAIIGSGLAKIYPNENIPLAKEITKQGALLSEFPMQTPPDRQNFPQRNRIVSGISKGILLIEAPMKSGAMITMEKGFSQKRPLFALPGRADNENFRGNHFLIKKQIAQLVEKAQDIANCYQDLFFQTPRTPISSSLPPLEKEEAQLLKQLPKEEISIDEIIAITKQPVSKLNIILMSLVLKKVVKEFPGKIYKKIFSGN